MKSYFENMAMKGKEEIEGENVMKKGRSGRRRSTKRKGMGGK